MRHDITVFEFITTRALISVKRYFLSSSVIAWFIRIHCGWKVWCLENVMRVPTMWNVRLAKTPFKLRNSKYFWVSSLTLIEYSIAKTLIRLRVCAGWSEPLLVAHTTLLEISCRGSIICLKNIQILRKSYHVSIESTNSVPHWPLIVT